MGGRVVLIVWLPLLSCALLPIIIKGAAVAKKGSLRNKQGKINEQFVAVRYSLLKGPLVIQGYLKPIDIFFYCMIRAKETGDPELDSRLKFTNFEAKMYSSITTFSQSKFRLWAFRCLEVTCWGRKTRKPSTFKKSMKWKTLIRMPAKIDRINTLVKRHESVMNFKPGPNLKRTKLARAEKKRELYMKIRKQIMEIPL